ncbi:hypothetical protein ACKFKG_05770 [Phormidesmis sp. 146-35]
MLTHHRKPVHLSIVSTDLPVWTDIQTIGTLYQKDQERFHVLLTEPRVLESREIRHDAFANRALENPQLVAPPMPTPRLLWLEISPYRVTMTMQGDGKLSYRHLWERGVYGMTRYWLQGSQIRQGSQIKLRNYTRSLHLDGYPIPEQLRLEYELWADQTQLGCYVLNLEIDNDGDG